MKIKKSKIMDMIHHCEWDNWACNEDENGNLWITDSCEWTYIKFCPFYEKETPLKIEDALKLIDDNSEGIVYKLEIIKKNWPYSSPYMIGKVVKQDKEDGKYLKEGNEIWNWRDNDTK